MSSVSSAFISGSNCLIQSVSCYSTSVIFKIHFLHRTCVSSHAALEGFEEPHVCFLPLIFTPARCWHCGVQNWIPSCCIGHQCKAERITCLSEYCRSEGFKCWVIANISSLSLKPNKKGRWNTKPVIETHENKLGCFRFSSLGHFCSSFFFFFLIYSAKSWSPTDFVMTDWYSG